MNNNSLFLYTAINAFCKVIGQSHKDANMLVVDITDHNGNLTGEAYLVHRDNLSTITPFANKGRYLKQPDLMPVPKTFNVISEHKQLDNVTLVIDPTTNTVHFCDTDAVFAQQVLSLLC